MLISPPNRLLRAACCMASTVLLAPVHGSFELRLEPPEPRALQRAVFTMVTGRPEGDLRQVRSTTAQSRWDNPRIGSSCYRLNSYAVRGP